MLYVGSPRRMVHCSAVRGRTAKAVHRSARAGLGQPTRAESSRESGARAPPRAQELVTPNTTAQACRPPPKDHCRQARAHCAVHRRPLWLPPPPGARPLCRRVRPLSRPPQPTVPTTGRGTRRASPSDGAQPQSEPRRPPLSGGAQARLIQLLQHLGQLPQLGLRNGPPPLVLEARHRWAPPSVGGVCAQETITLLGARRKTVDGIKEAGLQHPNNSLAARSANRAVTFAGVCPLLQPQPAASWPSRACVHTADSCGRAPAADGSALGVLGKVPAWCGCAALCVRACACACKRSACVCSTGDDAPPLLSPDPTLPCASGPGGPFRRAALAFPPRPPPPAERRWRPPPARSPPPPPPPPAAVRAPA